MEKAFYKEETTSYTHKEWKKVCVGGGCVCKAKSHRHTPQSAFVDHHIKFKAWGGNPAGVVCGKLLPTCV